MSRAIPVRRARPAMLLVPLALLSLIVVGCGKKSAITDQAHGDRAHAEHAHGHEHDEDEHDHQHGHEHGFESGGASFSADAGITLSEETRASLELKTAPVERGVLVIRREIVAQVYQGAPEPRALATLPVATAERLSGKKLQQGRVLRVDAHPGGATGLADVTLALDDVSGARPGDFVRLTITFESAGPVLSVPAAAVLRTAGGTFVYKVSGDAYRRTAVSVGDESDQRIEIKDGVQAGDDVVTQPVEQLWLIELRATKGGGHSH